MRMPIAFGALMVVAGCAPSPTSLVPAEVDRLAEVSFPYTPTAERCSQILCNYTQIGAGISAARVKDILGEPDQDRPLYGPQVKDAQYVGRTYWYFLGKPARESMDGAKWVRVSLDLNDNVTGVDISGH